MRKIIVSTLLLSFSLSALAGDKFAGINFHSSVPSKQKNALKNDLAFLYKLPIKTVDEEFKNMAQLPQVDGPHMFNWIYNRTQHILGERFEVTKRNLLSSSGHQFPSTPMNATQDVKVVMSNLGSALYLVGKKENTLIGLKLDGEKVYAKSTRVGIFKVGEGLFHERALVNSQLHSAANSVNRLGTLFHEARHSDGNGKHTAFAHDQCPSGHDYAGHAACEKVGNGSYSLGALALRNLVKNCTSCSSKDKTIIEASIADNLDRIIVTQNDDAETIRAQMRQVEALIKANKYLLTVVPASDRARIAQEIRKLETMLKNLKEQLAKSGSGSAKIKTLDPKPEGEYSEASVEFTNKLMNKVIK